MSQKFSLYEELTVDENLGFFLGIYSVPADIAANNRNDICRKTGLTGHGHRTVADLSGGWKQRVALACAMVHKPGLLFLDEPTAGLDPVAAASLNSDLRSLVADEQTTIFLTTHNLSEAERLCSLVGVLRQGRLIAYGRPQDLTGSGKERTMEVYSRKLNDPQLMEKIRSLQAAGSVRLVDDHLKITLDKAAEQAELIKELVLAGVAVDEARLKHSSLEQVFLTLMEENHA